MFCRTDFFSGKNAAFPNEKSPANLGKYPYPRAVSTISDFQVIKCGFFATRLLFWSNVHPPFFGALGPAIRCKSAQTPTFPKFQTLEKFQPLAGFPLLSGLGYMQQLRWKLHIVIQKHRSVQECYVARIAFRAFGERHSTPSRSSVIEIIFKKFYT